MPLPLLPRRARYSGSRKGRIFDGTSQNVLSGFHQGDVGVAHQNVWITAGSKQAGLSQSGWLLAVDRPRSFRAQGVPSATDKGYFEASQIKWSINAGVYSSGDQKSDWQCAAVLHYNRALTDAEAVQMEGWMSRTFNVSLMRRASRRLVGDDLGCQRCLVQQWLLERSLLVSQVALAYCTGPCRCQ
jgi:hypothetical protein